MIINEEYRIVRERGKIDPLVNVPQRGKSSIPEKVNQAAAGAGEPKPGSGGGEGFGISGRGVAAMAPVGGST
jgi:hypothetical protein